MFTTRRRSIRSSSWSRKKTRRFPRPLPLLAMAIGVVLGSELLLRAIANFSGLDRQFAHAPNELAQSYQLRFLSPAGQPYKTLPSSGKLLANRDPLMGYQLQPKQSTQFWTVNAQGFRDIEDVPRQKPSNETRIFVLGGSTAFGQLSSSNKAMFSHQLEQRLNAQVAAQRAKPNAYQPEFLPYTADEVEKVLQRATRLPDRQYRVINAAVPGYASGNVAQLMERVADYSPDVVIVLGGYDDLLLPSARSAVEIPGLDDILAGKSKNWGAQIMGAIGNGFNNLYLVRAPQAFQKADKVDPNVVRSLNTSATSLPLAQSLAVNASELDLRVAHYRDHLLQIVRWSAAAKKPLFIGIQPEVTGYGKTQPSANEVEIIDQLGKGYKEQVRTGYDKLATVAAQAAQSSAQAKVMNLYGMFGETGKGGMFLSSTNLTDSGNTVLAERFYRAIATDLAIKPKPFGTSE
jgi:hypothetical protein